jgi:hypothetical protein
MAEGGRNGDDPVALGRLLERTAEPGFFEQRTHEALAAAFRGRGFVFTARTSPWLRTWTASVRWPRRGGPDQVCPPLLVVAIISTLRRPRRGPGWERRGAAAFFSPGSRSRPAGRSSRAIPSSFHQGRPAPGGVDRAIGRPGERIEIAEEDRVMPWRGQRDQDGKSSDEASRPGGAAPVLMRCRSILRHCCGSVMTASTFIGEPQRLGMRPRRTRRGASEAVADPDSPHREELRGREDVQSGDDLQGNFQRNPAEDVQRAQGEPGAD